MSKKERMKWNGKIISVELLHQLASDHRIKDIRLRDSICGELIDGCDETKREYDQWELAFTDGSILVYV